MPLSGTERVYRRVRYARPRVPDDSALFAQAFVEELNVVRFQAGMQPMTLDPAQSETATRLAPQYFAALMGNQDERVADQVALGLLAGWDVEGATPRGSARFGLNPSSR